MAVPSCGSSHAEHWGSAILERMRHIVHVPDRGGLCRYSESHSTVPVVGSAEVRVPTVSAATCPRAERRSHMRTVPSDRTKYVKETEEAKVKSLVAVCGCQWTKSAFTLFAVQEEWLRLVQFQHAIRI